MDRYLKYADEHLKTGCWAKWVSPPVDYVSDKQTGLEEPVEQAPHNVHYLGPSKFQFFSLPLEGVPEMLDFAKQQRNVRFNCAHKHTE